MPPVMKIVLILALIALVMVMYGRIMGRRDSERSLTGLTSEVKRRIEQELRSGQKIAAVKTYRDATGAALVDAKKAVEEWFVPGRGFGGGQMDGSLTMEARKHISSLVLTGRREEAMDLYAQATGASPAEAQAIIRTWNTDEHI